MSKTPQFDWENPSNEVPSSALRIDAQCTLAENASNGDDSATFRLRARSGDPIDHWYWGKVAHDMSGFKLTGDKRKLAVLFEHQTPIGFALRKNISVDEEDGSLNVSGTFVKGRNEETDMATKVIDWMSGGIPFESSISFAGGDLKAQILQKDEVTEVNGKEFEGPGIIFRKWQLREVSIVTSGADSDTESALLTNGDTVSVSFVHSGENDMSEKSTPVIEESSANAPAGSVDLTAVNDSAEGGADNAQTPEDAQPTELASGTPAAKYFEAFGEQRGSWYFAHGIPFDEAMAQDNKSLRDRVEQLESKLDAQASRGHEEALPASEGDVSEPDQFKDKQGAWSEMPVFFNDKQD